MKKTTLAKVLMIGAAGSAALFAFAFSSNGFSLKASDEKYQLVLDKSNNKVHETFAHDSVPYVNTKLGSPIQLFIEKGYGSAYGSSSMVTTGGDNSWASVHEACRIWNNDPLNNLSKITVETEHHNVDKDFYLACLYGPEMDCGSGEITYQGQNVEADAETGHDIYVFDFSETHLELAYFGIEFYHSSKTAIGQDYYIETYSIVIEYGCN